MAYDTEFIAAVSDHTYDTLLCFRCHTDMDL